MSTDGEGGHCRQANPSSGVVPWSGFDLINAFNAWKRSEEAGRVVVVAPGGSVTKLVTGLEWRHEVSTQVFEEAAIDLGRGLAAYAEAKAGRRRSRPVGFPRQKKKGHCRDRFRLRNKDNGIRIGGGHPRSVTLPRIGTIRVHDNTRALRRLLRPVRHIEPDTGRPVLASRAKVLFATVSRHGDRWYISLNVRAPDLHEGRRHLPRSDQDHSGWVGVDRGLAAFVAKAARRLSRQHARIADKRRSFLHEVSSQLVKTHDRLCMEDLAVANLVGNRHLARAIGDAAWADFARQLAYKAAWRGGQVMVCDRWFPSTRTCSRCGLVRQRIGLVERTLHCDGCGLVIDRDRNAAANLASWAEAACIAAAQAPARQAAAGSTTPLEGKALAVAVAMAQPPR